MTKDDAIKFFGTQEKLAAALGLKQPTISTWRRVPDIHQIRLEVITANALKADPSAWSAKEAA